MTTITRVKMGFVVAGLIAFAIGVYLDDARWRYAAIACIAIAWVTRFVKPRVDASPNEWAVSAKSGTQGSAGNPE